MRFLFPFIILSCVSCGQRSKALEGDTSMEDENHKNSNWVWIEYTSGTKEWFRAEDFDPTVVSGSAIRFYDNGQQFSHTYLTNGIEDSTQQYDTTGLILYTKWHNDKGWERTEYEKLGSFKWYHQNLNLRKTGNIIDIEENKRGNREFLEGEVITYFKNGDTASVEHFTDLQFKHGEFKKWYKNGQLESIENFITNMRVGVYQKYSEDGKLTEDANFGFASGFVNEYYPSGGLKSKIHYYQYVKDGLANFYDEDGNLIRSCEYAKDSLISP